MAKHQGGVRRMLLACGIAAALAGGTVAAQAQSRSPGAQETRDYAIPAQDLAGALRTLALQSGQDVVFDPDIVAGKTTAGLQGAYTAADAVRVLLEGSQLVFRRTPSGGFVIAVAAPASGDAHTLDTINVFGTQEEQLSVGSKSGQTLRETPKSVTVVTSERIEAQQLTTLQEALVQTTGVVVNAYSTLEVNYYSRGIRLETLQFDGGAPIASGGFGFIYSPDTATLDRIEMLRGVDGMYSGAGEPGGVINLVRKRPEPMASVRLNLSAGNWDSYRGVVDATGPLALDGRLRGRAVASHMDRGYHQDRYTTETNILYGVLELDATDSLLLTAGANYERRKDDGYPGWSGMPRYSDGRHLGLPRSYNAMPDWSRWHLKTLEVFAKAEQKYGETGVLRLNVNQIDQESTLRQGVTSGTVDPVTLGGPIFYATAADYVPTQRTADLSASGRFQLFGLSHGYTFGADYAEVDGGGRHFYALPPEYFGSSFDFFRTDPTLLPEPAWSVHSAENWFASTNRVDEQTQRGVYATVGLQLAQPLRLTLGGRHGKYTYHRVIEDHPSGDLSVRRYTDSKFIPSAALSYTLSDRWTAYTSYGETFKVQAHLLAPPYPGAGPLDPVIGSNLELGIKGEIFKRVNAAASIYRLIRRGEGALDPTSPSATNPADGSSCCYIAQGEIRVEGLDLELSGTVLPGWQVFGGYTYTETGYEGDAAGASVLSVTPRHQVKIWNTWRLPGRLSAFTVNTGVVAQSAASSFGGLFHYGGHALWNASVQYQMTDHWTVSVYGDNLTDKVYWQPIGTLYSQNIYGTPRSVNLSLRGRW